jgi:hypothetical protein
MAHGKLTFTYFCEAVSKTRGRHPGTQLPRVQRWIASNPVKGIHDGGSK